MLNFRDFLKEETEGEKLKHITHPEDRPLMHGHSGFEHAEGALKQAEAHIDKGENNNKLTMKYDGSPSLVFGKDKKGKMWVASKSAFNANPKINYTPEDIDKNHGHAPGLASKLKSALNELPKVQPKKGVTYQGDLMHTPEDHKVNSNGSVSYTPNTITYTAKGKDAEAVKKSKLGLVVHTKYDAKGNATPDVSEKEFKHHPDVHIHDASFDTKGTPWSEKDKHEFNTHMHAARDLHLKGGEEMYRATERHGGDGGHLATYINQTVRDSSTPNRKDFSSFVMAKYKKMAEKLKTPAKQQEKIGEGEGQVAHIEHHGEHYDNLFKMHNHLQKAKDKLVSALDKQPARYEHHIDGKESKPEGYVVNHNGVPNKLVNRAEFARSNLLKVRK
jgi:hypothetical protein